MKLISAGDSAADHIVSVENKEGQRTLRCVVRPPRALPPLSFGNFRTSPKVSASERAPFVHRVS